MAPSLKQYIAIDDCSCDKIVGLSPRRTIARAMLFLVDVMEVMLFSIQRVQTERRREFLRLHRSISLNHT